MGPFIPRRGKIKETPIDHAPHMHMGVINYDRQIACTTCAWVSERTFATHNSQDVMDEWLEHRGAMAVARVWS